MAKIEMDRGTAIIFLLVLGIIMLIGGPEPLIGGLMIGAAILGIITLVITRK